MKKKLVRHREILMPRVTIDQPARRLSPKGILFRKRKRKTESRHMAGIAERINGNTEFPASLAHREKYLIAVTCDPARARARSSRK